MDTIALIARGAFAVGLGFAVVGAPPSSAAPRAREDAEKPNLSLKATPIVSFSPSRVRFVAELRGGANDFADYYCPDVEWEWGDDTMSETRSDCEPYEVGRSAIQRRFTATHTYSLPGSFRVVFKLKRNRKVITTATASVQVKPGMPYPGAGPWN
jgi:hypothetical protein